MLLTPKEGAENYSDIGCGKAALPVPDMLVAGIMSGIVLGFCAAVTNMAAFTIESASAARVLSGVLFGFGLGIIILMGFELFTGNTLMVISVLDKKISPAAMLKNWLWVYIGNFIGSMIFSFLAARFGWPGAGSGALAEYTMKAAQSKMTMSFGNAFVMGILCNIMVTAGVFISLEAKDGISRLALAWAPVMIFVVCGFNHSVADMSYCMMGLFARVPYAQAAAAFTGLSWGNYFLGNMLPVTLGNIVGGAAVGWAVWFCRLRHRRRPQ